MSKKRVNSGKFPTTLKFGIQQPPKDPQIFNSNPVLMIEHNDKMNGQRSTTFIFDEKMKDKYHRSMI